MIYAIGDLHLDFTKEKTMEVFGEKWINYEEKIFKNWEFINDDDLVLIPGDFSWANDIEAAYIDLKRIDSLSGTKILTKGNHDYWWNSLSKLRKLDLKTIKFIQNDSISYDGLNICGIRGWLDPTNKDFKEADEKIFKRELIRADMSLSSVKNDKDIVMMMHYPPFDKEKQTNDLFTLLKKYKVTDLVYGHLHGLGHANIVEGKIDGINVKCVSSDYIDFKPVLIRS
ncbi:MAG: metallophosphoesterase [Finegoldia sp.]|nr:metallophosphoesterase [Finegoldia sp.]